MATAPNLRDWRALFHAAQVLYQLAPWGWMDDSDLVGVQDPVTGEVGYVSVLGKLGEALGVVVYPGREGFDSYLNLLGADPEDFEWDVYIGQRCLTLFFDSREDLSSRDLEVIRKLGLRFRGKQAWPKFRSHRPGYEDWYLDQGEVRFFTVILEQLQELATFLREKPDLLEQGPRGHILVRMLDQENGDWKDQWFPEPPPAPLWPVSLIPEGLVGGLRANPRPRRGIWEVDVFGLPALIRGEKGSPAHYVASLLCVHQESGFVINSGIEPYPKRFEKLAHWFVSALEDSELGWPEEVRVIRPELVGALGGLLGELGIKLALVGELEALEEAKESLLGWLEQGVS